MSSPAALLAAHALFVPGEPARFGRFALWGAGIEGGERLDLFRPSAGRVRKLPTPVRYLTIEEALPILLVERDKSPSLALWSAATRAGLDLIARGRLRPGVTDAGYGTWRIGDLADSEACRLHELAAALPPEGCAQPLPGAWPAVRVPEPATLIRELWDALADTLPRTAEASRPPGEERAHPFATWPPAKVRGPHHWLRPAGDARLLLRVVLSPGPAADPRGAGEPEDEREGEAARRISGSNPGCAARPIPVC